MPFSDAVAMLMPPLRMRERQPVHETGEIAIPSRPHHEMPVIRHDAVGQESHRYSFTGLGQHPFKRRIITVVVKQTLPRVRAIEDVIGDIGGCRA